jgi:hypothetical protein
MGAAARRIGTGESVVGPTVIVKESGRRTRRSGRIRRTRDDRAAEALMKGVVFLGDRKLELREFPDPTPGPREVVLEIKASGMCGSDLHNYRAPANPGAAVTGGIRRQGG